MSASTHSVLLSKAQRWQHQTHSVLLFKSSEMATPTHSEIISKAQRWQHQHIQSFFQKLKDSSIIKFLSLSEALLWYIINTLSLLLAVLHKHKDERRHRQRN
ncbi:hypothetical protein JTE90_025854 [Oedothorax gibbosus]|uniref:Uncharacterized protein n=1 Tax=Oedothorax gibbosus TaxID=931172 RepID=A0AAV6ULP9_9ARAC|nr:hypothetical protein JTE90_025854 [Oedothorax gibbosus]